MLFALVFVSALLFYGKAIEKGKNLQRFFAANSAFESGKIYEAKGDLVKAKYYYNQNQPKSTNYVII